MRVMQKPNWSKWSVVPEFELWQAAALSLNIEPDSMMINVGDDAVDSFVDLNVIEQFAIDQFNSPAQRDELDKRRSILKSFVDANEYFSRCTRTTRVEHYIKRREFILWVVATEWTIPDELKMLDVSAKKTTTAINQPLDQSDEQGTTSSSNLQPNIDALQAKVKIECEQNLTNNNTLSKDEKLAALFDPVHPRQLAKMFPTISDTEKSADDWRNFSERNGRNGLSAAKYSRANYNPYWAARWWLEHKHPKGWDWARCLRVLANNLPARSTDEKNQLIDQDLQ